MDINEVTLLGRIGKDPEVKQPGKTAVCNFTMATEKRWKSDGEDRKDTQWHRVVAWDKLAERIGQLKKGQLIFVRGELTTRNYEKNGTKVYVTEVRAQVVYPVAPATAPGDRGRTVDRSTSQVPQDEEEIPY